MTSHQCTPESCADTLPVAITRSMPATRAVRCQYLPRLRLIEIALLAGAHPYALRRAPPMQHGPCGIALARRPASYAGLFLMLAQREARVPSGCGQTKTAHS